MHYKTIKFNIKISLNIHNFHICGALCAKSVILRLCARCAPKVFAIFQILPPPHPKNGSTPLFSPPPPPPPLQKSFLRPCPGPSDLTKQHYDSEHARSRGYSSPPSLFSKQRNAPCFSVTLAGWD